MVDLQQTLKYVCLTKIHHTFKRWTIYEDRIADVSKRLKDQRRGHTESQSELARQSEAKRKQAPQSEANVCRPRRRRRTQSPKKPPLLIAQDTHECTEHQHKLEVAFSYLERNNELELKFYTQTCGVSPLVRYLTRPLKGQILIFISSLYREIVPRDGFYWNFEVWNCRKK